MSNTPKTANLFAELNYDLNSGFQKEIHALDMRIDKLAKRGFVKGHTIFQDCDEILEAINRKRILINYSIVVEECFLNLPENFKSILSMYFVDKLSCNEISIITNCNLRTCFRHLNKAIELYINNKESKLEKGVSRI